MKASEAIKVLSWMSPDTPVELIFPDAVKELNKPRPRPLTEGEMAALPMYSLDDTFMSGRWKD